MQILKNSKTITFDQLSEELKKHRQMQNMDYKTSDIKERVEYLITNEYCERDESDRNKLIYKP